MKDLNKVVSEVGKAVSGKNKAIITVLLAIMANGNILIEDIPGVGKTTMAVAFSKALGLKYKRVQFTPDTLPSDITGFNVYNKAASRFEFNEGAAFCNLFLADELNRASSRTQAALLEAMEEHQVTVDGKTYELSRPFSVIATQNPVGAAGTQLLPDSQVDRFTVKITMGYPDRDAECEMIMRRSRENPLERIEQVMTKDELIDLQEEVRNVFVKREIAQYIVALIQYTRCNPLISRGASPRAAVSLMDMSKAFALASGRDYVVPADVQNVFSSTIAHRIILSPEAASKKMTENFVLSSVLREVKAPRIG